MIPSMRADKSSVSTSATACSSPIPVDRRRKDIAPPVAIIVFEGMQSQRWAAPPTTSRSTIVTCAPSRAAYVAAVLPAGPPPMIRNRVVTRQGYVRDVAGHGRRRDARLCRVKRPVSVDWRDTSGGRAAVRYRELPVSEPTTTADDGLAAGDGAVSGSGLAAERARRQAEVDDLRAAGHEPYPVPLRSHAHRRRRAGPVARPAAGHGDGRRGHRGRSAAAQARRRQAGVRHDRRPRRGDPAVHLPRRHRRRGVRRRQVTGPRRLGRRPRHRDDDAAPASCRSRSTGSSCWPRPSARSRTSGTGWSIRTRASASATPTSSSTPTPGGRSRSATR